MYFYKGRICSKKQYIRDILDAFLDKEFLFVAENIKEKQHYALIPIDINNFKVSKISGTEYTLDSITIDKVESEETVLDRKVKDFSDAVWKAVPDFISFSEANFVISKFIKDNVEK